MNNVIAFMGEYGSGKDYFCDFLVREYGAYRFAFADVLKKFCVQLHPWMKLDYANEVKDKPLIQDRNPNNLTPREIWLKVSTAFRDIDTYYFTRLFEENELAWIERNSYLPCIITDFRTKQEAELLLQHKIPVIKIELDNREGMKPSSFEDFVREFKDYDALYINKKDGTERFHTFFKGFVSCKQMKAFY